MSFDIDQREREGISILAPRGRLTIGEPVEAFRSRLESLLADGRSSIVLDLSGTEYIDSSALGCLVVAHKRSQEAGGIMAMFALNERNMDLMILTKLATVFQLFDDEASAVNSCFPGREAPRFDILDFVQKRKHREGKASQ